jgi:Protein of unknown function (DUF3999)
MTIRFPLWISILFVLCTQCCHADTPNYAYAWPITTSDTGSAHQIELTTEVYAALVSSDLRDLDVLNADGDSVPTAPYRHTTIDLPIERRLSLPMFVLPPENAAAPVAEDEIHLHIERAPDGKLRTLDAVVAPAAPPPTMGGVGNGGARHSSSTSGVGATSPTSANAARTADGTSKILLDASGVHEPIASLLVYWDSHTDAIAHFSVSASDDLQTWHVLVPNGAVMRLTQDGNVLEKHEIPLDHRMHAYLSVTHIEADTALPALTVQVQTQLPAAAQKPIQQWIEATSDGPDAVDATAIGASSVYRYHLSAPLPVGVIDLTLADDNSIARATLSTRLQAIPPAPWLRGADVVAFRLRDGEATLSNDPIRVSTLPRTNEWRVAFASPVAHAPALKVAYTPDRFVFLAQGAPPYRLVAGSANARRVDAPMDVALNRLRASGGTTWAPPLASLGSRVDLQGASALAVTPKVAASAPWKTWLLWSVLVAAAGVVALLALSLLRKR